MRDEVDLRSDEHGGEHHKMRSSIMEFAEAKRKRPDDAMDTSALAKEAANGISGDDYYEHWGDGAWWWDEPDYYSAEANDMGYGKGKGKGKSTAVVMVRAMAREATKAKAIAREVTKEVTKAKAKAKGQIRAAEVSTSREMPQA